MIKIKRFFYFHLLCIPLFLISYFTQNIHGLLLSYSIVTVHEFFHLFAALILSVRVKSIIMMPFGMTLRLSSSVIKSPAKEAVIAASGPFANLLMIALATVYYLYKGSMGLNLLFFILPIST